MDATKENTVQGLFIQSLKRNNTKIREDRASTIADDAQLMYKRYVEDLQVQIRRMRNEQSNLLDLSPTSADSLTLASDFDAVKFVNTDVELGMKLRNLEIKLEVATKRYTTLFGA